MMKKNKSSPEDKKKNAARKAILGFLALLNAISVSPDVREFCTPGHKAGRGFEAMLAAEQTSFVLTLPEEVS